MFADLIRRMTAPAPQTLSDPDARVALGALLVRIARTDGRYDPAEKAQIDRTLMSRYGLTEPDAGSGGPRYCPVYSRDQGCRCL